MLISACPETWTDSSIAEDCQEGSEYDQIVLDNRGLHFRNKACAECNGAAMDTLQVYLDFMVKWPCPYYDTKRVFFPSATSNITSGEMNGYQPDAHLCFSNFITSCSDDSNANSSTVEACKNMGNYTPVAMGYHIIYKKQVLRIM